MTACRSEPASREQAGRFLETIRHLHPSQVGYGLYYRALSPWLARVRVRDAEEGRRPWPAPFPTRTFLPPRQIAPGVFRAVGETGEIHASRDWQGPGRSRLWVFSVHYLDDLALPAAADDGQRSLLNQWIVDNPPAHGFGWHPYVISQRLVNMVKWCSTQGVCDARWLASIDAQARSLERRFEYHIRGNHLLANAKALLFAGAFLAGPRADAWLERGVTELCEQVDEQFLSDGGHFERSPMYQSLVLWDLCDVLALASATELLPLVAARDRWVKALGAGLSWLEGMTHPDGLLSFFNDAAFGMSPTLAELKTYHHAVTGSAIASPAASDRVPSVLHLAESGYIAVRPAPGHLLVIDAAPIGPDYQPGHAHADTLSFELSLFGSRVVVNSGTSTYAESEARVAERATAAHSTVEIDGANSSDVWRSFRVAARARPFGVAVEDEGGRVRVRASHDGYRRLPGGPTHTRSWVVEPRRLVITDVVAGPHRRAVARFYLHPDVRVFDDGRLMLRDEQTVRWRASGGSTSVVPSRWHPEFGASVASHCIEVELAAGSLTLTLEW